MIQSQEREENLKKNNSNMITHNLRRNEHREYNPFILLLALFTFFLNKLLGKGM